MVKTHNEPQKLTESDNAKTISVAVGEAFHIDLQSNPTTGFTWIREGVKGSELSDHLFQVKSSYGQVAKSNGRLLVGQGGTQHFEVTALLEGTHKFVLIYNRPWLAPSSAVKRYAITVKVH
ncbi:putative Chagasin family peptidase inhibitor I42 [Trypanosoma vivax]|uniref:Putative inhibitor of cysteine peptidase (Putative icp) n=1 Tax=Trypanosoma vivax (strain Y486) TaxID=1055687 RepID=G0U1P1_TRYVY|nr:putative ICP [Trypanosoma vivax]KAH8617008.1 putative Chagasin family peptidase inhibitor I42 [Trypanosoma vivax]CCC49998.1 putative ICP [Trypanosoma vivax Y486]